jgi:hypothetical protein
MSRLHVTGSFAASTFLMYKVCLTRKPSSFTEIYYIEIHLYAPDPAYCPDKDELFDQISHLITGSKSSDWQVTTVSLYV